MSENILNDIINKTGFENFAVRIEDGSMVITPSDAGVALFGHVSQAETTISDLQDLLGKMQEDYEEVRDDNAFLRDLLEETVETIEGTFPELASRLLLVAYPIKGIEVDGEEVKFSE